MKFTLKEYARSYTDEEILSDIRLVSSRHGTDYVSLSVYKKEGKFSQCAIQGHFGTWVHALELAGLRNTRTCSELKLVSDEDYYKDIRRVAEFIGKTTVPLKEYEKFGRYSSGNVFHRFGCWDLFLKNAGLDPTGLSKKRVSEKDCFDEIERVWTNLGRQPTSTDIIKHGVSKFSIDIYKRRFGGWRKALEAFVEYINKDVPNHVSEEKHLEEDSINLNPDAAKVDDFKSRKRTHRTPRNINTRLRFLVLQRDYFKCCCCGASPAKDPSVTLHVDHIQPWVNGGETVIENLQTLCSKCNLGKGDVKME